MGSYVLCILPFLLSEHEGNMRSISWLPLSYQAISGCTRGLPTIQGIQPACDLASECVGQCSA